MGNTPPRGLALPAVSKATWQLWAWSDARVHDWPASARGQLGRRLLSTLLDLFDLLTRARRRLGAAETLREAKHRTAFARTLLRAALNGAYLSREQHQHALDRLDEIGRQVGAWMWSVGA